jgi:hypothetical protein
MVTGNPPRLCQGGGRPPQIVRGEFLGEFPPAPDHPLRLCSVKRKNLAVRGLLRHDSQAVGDQTKAAARGRLIVVSSGRALAHFRSSSRGSEPANAEKRVT